MANSVHGQCVDGVHAAVVALGLSGVAADAVIKAKFPVDREATTLAAMPCVLVTAAPGQETLQFATNERDDVGYPVLVTLVQGSNTDNTVPDALLLWRQSVRRAFHNKRPSAVASAVTGAVVVECLVEPGPVVDPGRWADSNLDVSGLTIRVVCREARS